MRHPEEGIIHAWLDGALPEQRSVVFSAFARECYRHGQRDSRGGDSGARFAFVAIAGTGAVQQAAFGVAERLNAVMMHLVEQGVELLFHFGHQLRLSSLPLDAPPFAPALEEPGPRLGPGRCGRALEDGQRSLAPLLRCRSVARSRRVSRTHLLT